MGNRAFVSVTNDLYTDNRVNKICLFLMEQGYKVTLIGRIKSDSSPLNDRPYATKRFKLLWEKGPKFYAAYNFRLFFYLLFRRADLLVANDLDTLTANFLAVKFKFKTKLVYDSHEYFTQVPELIHRPKTQKIWERIEGYIFPRLQTIYTVNQSIADIYTQKYKKNVRVVRNISPSWNAENIPSRKELGLPENQFLVILQGAGINVDRGAEEAMEAMKLLTDVTLIIVGSGDVIGTLKELVKTYELQNRVLFFGKRPYAEMMAFTSHADLGLTLDKPTSDNYRYSLPNKVFDYIHAETPIIGTNLVEVAQIITTHQVGTVINELSPETLASAIHHYQEHPDLLLTQKANCRVASAIENWENEQDVLKQIYPSIER
jgi:glycosyltransferase involved in cell wall biosynthesis